MINSFASRSLLLIFILILAVCLPADLLAQTTVSANAENTAKDSLTYLSNEKKADSSIFNKDTLSKTDSINADSVPRRNSKNALDAKVDYKANDSIVFNLQSKKAFLYGNSEIYYKDIILKAEYVSMGFDDKIVYASGVPDSLGNLMGNPEFEEGGQKYKAKEMRYNFDTKKGMIYEIITQDGEAFLHGYKVKKADSNIMYLNGGCFTTCDLDHPHYGVEFSRAKVITGDKVITGTSYMTIEDAPTPLVIPFGFFPSSKKRASGVLIPSYGYASNRGYYLNNGGYYIAVSDYWDVAIRGDIYTNLSFALRPEANYFKRYKYAGNFRLQFEDNKQGITGTSSYERFQDFAVQWEHRQDPKANPNSTFSASVNVVSPRFGKWSTNSYDYFASTTTSSISYSTKLGQAFNLSTSLGESYNTNTRIFDLNLPTVSLSSKQFYPFRTSKSSSPFRWFENVNIKYTMNFKNSIQSPDSTLFEGDIWKRMNNGFQHSIPINSTMRVFKYFNWDNTISYTERWYFKTINDIWDLDSNKAIAKDTSWGFSANRYADFSTSLNTKIYGMANFKNFYVTAIRHVFTPNLSLSYHPDFGNPWFGYWKSNTDTAGMEHYYSVYQGGIYGYPSRGKSGALGFSLGNNLEMKVRSKSDTVTGTKKIMLIENLTVSMSYDFAKDSINLSPLNISGRTTLFKNLYITYSGTFSPYYIDTSGRMTNEFLWHRENKVFKKDNSKWDFSLNWNLSPETFRKKQKPDAPALSKQDSLMQSMYVSPFNNPNENLPESVDFSIPWNLNINYTLSFVNDYIADQRGYKSTTVQTLNIRGDFNLTPKWKIGFTTGYDFDLKDFTYTSIDFYRDLHCWEMRFNWIPYGFRKGWNFTIAIKANMLKDVKYEMKSDFRDTQPYY